MGFLPGEICLTSTCSAAFSIKLSYASMFDSPVVRSILCERLLPKRIIISQDFSDKLASSEILASVKLNFPNSRNAELVAWETFQETVRVQTRAVAAYQNAVCNFKLVWEDVQSEDAAILQRLEGGFLCV